MDFIFVNLFLLAIVLICAGSFFVLGSIVTAMHLSHDAEAWAFIAAGVLSLFITYYVSRWLHRMIDRHVINRRAR